MCKRHKNALLTSYALFFQHLNSISIFPLFEFKDLLQTETVLLFFFFFFFFDGHHVLGVQAIFLCLLY